MFLHDEKSLKFRSPNRAVEKDTEIKISLECKYVCKKVYLVTVFNDKETQKYEMELSCEPANDCEIGVDLTYYFVKFTVTTGLYFYYFEIEDEEKKYWFDKNGCHNADNNLNLWQITVHKQNFLTPEFVKGGIMYHIFVDRFNKSGTVLPRDGFILHENWSDIPHYLPDELGVIRNNDVYGGNIRGIIEKLDYFKSLNVNILYLSPIFEASSNHKYNTADYEKIDIMFGTDEDFDELIEKANKKGMKIILDGVFNHVGDDSIYFNRYGKYSSIGAYQSESSKYYDWFTFTNWNEEYDAWWGIKSLPAIKKDHPVFRAYICGVNGVLDKWLNRGISGFRIDVADELSDRMLRGIYRACKDTSNENIIIGEIWEDASNKVAYGVRKQYLLGKQLDSVMNYPVKDAIIDYLKSGDAYSIANVVDKLINNYPKNVLNSLMNIIGTHDTTRILTVLGTDDLNISKEKMASTNLTENEIKHAVILLKMATLMQFTLPGFPCIYYGDEAGVQGYHDPFNRRSFPWGNENVEISKWYLALGKIRAENDVFTCGDYVFLNANKSVFYYKRVENCEEVYVCINLSNEDFKIYNVEGFDNYSLITSEKFSHVKSTSCEVFIKQQTNCEYYI